MHFCAYQERAQQEVRDKLYQLGVAGRLIEQVIARLITEIFLSEERFAMQYARGKFNQKQWGKIKIKQGLKLKQIPNRLIKKTLKSIDLEDYTRTLALLLEKQATLLKSLTP